MNHIIETYGYWAVALFVLAESFGVPLPGETAVIVAGTYAGHSHRLSPWLIFLAAAVAAVVGGQIGYFIGEIGGYRLVRRYGHKIRLDMKKYRIARYLFDTKGWRVVFFGRFVSIVRTYAAFLAGTSRMNFRRFVVANLSGGIVWAAIYSYLSYIAGNTLRRTSSALTWILVGVAIILIVGVALFMRRRMDDLSARAEAAYPDDTD